jgi:hypothetical protein
MALLSISDVPVYSTTSEFCELENPFDAKDDTVVTVVGDGMGGVSFQE